MGCHFGKGEGGEKKSQYAHYKKLDYTTGLKPPREFSAPCIQLIKEKCCNFLELFYDCLGSLKL